MDDEIFRNNLQCIEEYCQHLDRERLQSLNTEAYHVEACKINGYTLKAKGEDGSFFYVNSRYDPIKEAVAMGDEWAKELDNEMFILQCGLGLGYGVACLLNLLDQDSVVVIIEPNFDLFNYLIRYIDFREVFKDKRFHLLIGEEGSALEEALFRNINMPNLEKIKVLDNPIYEKLFPDDYGKIKESILKEMKQSIIRQNTMLEFSKLWYVNQIKNLKYVVEGYDISHFVNLLKDKPVIMVSAGPSLNKNVEYLKKVKGKIFIICAYTALKVLENHNITPDMVVSIDGKQWIYEQQEDYVFDVPLLCVSCANHKLLSLHKGKKIILITALDFFLMTMLTKMNRTFELVASGESVACIIMSFLALAGANPVIMIGQDLALTDDKNHADGTYYDDRNTVEKAEGKKLFVEDIYGGQIRTTEPLYLFLTWFERYVKNCGDDKMIVDATEGGAKIHGTEICTLEEAVHKYYQESPDFNLDEVLREFYERSSFFSLQEKEELLKELKKMLEDIEKLEKPLDDGIMYSEKLEQLYKHHDEPDPKEVSRLLRKFNQVDIQLEEVSESTELIALAFQNSVHGLHKKRDKNLSEGLYVAARSKYLYEGIKESVMISLPVLKQAVLDVEESCIGSRL